MCLAINPRSHSVSIHPAMPDLPRTILRSPPARVLVLGFLLLVVMGLNADVMAS